MKDKNNGDEGKNNDNERKTAKQKNNDNEMMEKNRRHEGDEQRQ